MTKTVADRLGAGGLILAALCWAAMAYLELVFFFSPFHYRGSLPILIPLALIGAIGAAALRVALLVNAEERRPITARVWTVSLVLGLIPGVCLIVGAYLLRGS